jgi:hypothetical protein
MADIRLGDVIDDWCVKCRRLTNHSIVSIIDGKAAKVRCRTCYHDHDYRHEEAPPSKKEQKKQALFNEVLATISPDAEPEAAPEPEQVEETEPAEETELVEPAAQAEQPEAADAAPARKKNSKKARGV